MEVRDESIHTTELEAWSHEEIRATNELGAAGQRLQHAHGRRSHGADALGSLDAFPGDRIHFIALAVDRVLREQLGCDGAERVQPNVERDPLDVEAGRGDRL